MAYNAVTPPEPGSQVMVHVTAIRSPHVFYVILPFHNVDMSMLSEEEFERKLRVFDQGWILDGRIQSIKWAIMTQYANAKENG